MSAQRSRELSTTQSTSRGEQQRGQRGALARRQAGLPTVPSLLFDPLGFFDDSFSLIRRIQQEMNRVFSLTGLGSLAAPGGDLTSAVWVPAVELASQDGNLVVSVELPGLTDEDVTVEIRDNVLIVRGERQVERQEAEGGIRRTERRYGEFYRAIALPEEADAEHARAEFQDGVLRITIPVPESASNRREIPVQTTASASAQQQQQQRQATEKQQPAEKKPAA